MATFGNVIDVSWQNGSNRNKRGAHQKVKMPETIFVAGFNIFYIYVKELIAF